jgi:hypothetical protein
MRRAYSSQPDVQGRDHRHRHDVLDAPDLLEVGVGPEAELVGAGQVRRGLGGRVRVDLEVVLGATALARDLLLEERVHHDGGRARVLEAAHGAEIVDHGRGAGQERMGQAQAEITGGEVHG